MKSHPHVITVSCVNHSWDGGEAQPSNTSPTSHLRASPCEGGITWWSAKAGPPSLTFTHRCQSLTKGLCRFVCEEHELPMITAFEGYAAANAASQKKGAKGGEGR